MGITDPLNYELHIPMVMNRQLLKSLLKYKNSLWRSLYGNVYNVAGSEMEDVKVYAPNEARKGFDYKQKDIVFLSSTDIYFDPIKKELLNKKFPSPSIYESSAL
jgi:hypothetical protein